MMKSCKSKKKKRQIKLILFYLNSTAIYTLTNPETNSWMQQNLFRAHALNTERLFFSSPFKPFIYLAALAGNGEYRAAAFSYNTTWL